MTTRIHIVNFGPDLVVAETPTTTPVKIWPHESQNFYVYDNEVVTVGELKQPVKTGND
jgi:hypothetical protein